MHPNADLIHRFYSAFQSRDGAAMAACYTDDASFGDPVFTDLQGREVGGMWRFLCERGQDLAVTFRDVAADDHEGSAHWDATYTFSATGRRVVNRIDAKFRFRDGKIAWHRDHFDLGAWARQALGWKGLLIGLPPVRAGLRRQAKKGLDGWLRKQER